MWEPVGARVGARVGAHVGARVGGTVSYMWTVSLLQTSSAARIDTRCCHLSTMIRTYRANTGSENLVATTVFEFAMLASNTFPSSTSVHVDPSELVDTLYAVTLWSEFFRPCVRTPMTSLVRPQSICHHSPLALVPALHACVESSLPAPCETPIGSLFQTDDAEQL